jgi:two-component system, cell cycle sensor histidine kinase and response regulator CckA
VAVERFATCPHEFVAVLLDLTMPVMNGEEALRKIKAIRSDIPVVLSSGYNEIEAMGRFAESGLAGFLQKPYTITALARKIKRAIRDTEIRRGAH